MGGAEKCIQTISELDELADKMGPSLDSNDKETLAQILQNLKDKCHQMVAAGEARSEELQRGREVWEAYQDAADDAAHMLRDVETRWEATPPTPPSNPQHAADQIQETHEFLNFLFCHEGNYLFGNSVHVSVRTLKFEGWFRPVFI